MSYYIENNYFQGWTQLRYAFVGELSVAVGLLSAPLANYLSRRFGIKVPMLAGLLATAIGQCLAGLSHQFGAFLILQGLVFGSGKPLGPVMFCNSCSRRLGLGLVSNNN